MPSDLAKIQGLQALQSALADLPSELGGESSYAVGSPIEYGPYLEQGTSRMPAYPWLQPAVDEAVRNGAQIAAGSSTVDDLIRTTAVTIEANARNRLENNGTRPFPQSGTLAGSVTTVPLD